jgi:hypothetical protein
MKYLTDYIKDDQTNALNKAGAFYAFSESQFNESKVDGVKYVNAGGGLVCPKDTIDQLLIDLKTAYKNGIGRDIEENGLTAIIDRELKNHECYYTGDIDDCVDALKSYPVTIDDILQVFNTAKSSPEVLATL